MNERILELERQCWGTRQLTGSAHSWHTSFDSQKFAWLIIFECVKLAVFNGDTKTGQAIKEHFGVER